MNRRCENMPFSGEDQTRLKHVIRSENNQARVPKVSICKCKISSGLWQLPVDRGSKTFATSVTWGATWWRIFWHKWRIAPDDWLGMCTFYFLGLSIPMPYEGPRSCKQKKMLKPVEPCTCMLHGGCYLDWLLATAVIVKMRPIFQTEGEDTHTTLVWNPWRQARCTLLYD